MEIVTTLLNFIKTLFVSIGAYKFGKKTKENEQLKAENEKLKKYKNIDDDEYCANDVYDARMWGKK